MPALACLCRAEAAVVAALLHDTLDDTDVEFGEIEERFGSEVGAVRVGVCWPLLAGRGH